MPDLVEVISGEVLAATQSIDTTSFYIDPLNDVATQTTASALESFRTRTLEAATADKVLAEFEGTELALFFYRDGSKGGSSELGKWAQLSHEAQVARGRAHFRLPSSHLFQIETSHAVVILQKPIVRYGIDQTEEYCVRVNNPPVVTAQTLAYGLYSGGPGKLSYLRAPTSIRIQDGGSVMLGYDPLELQEGQVTIIERPSNKALAQASGEVALWCTTQLKAITASH